MLWDPSRDKKVEVDPLSLPALIAWLETKPAGETYRYGRPSTCLAAQYNRSIGRQYETVWTPFPPDRRASFDYCLEWIAGVCDRTFGDALRVAREFLAEREVK
jgi:hypothetical protein